MTEVRVLEFPFDIIVSHQRVALSCFAPKTEILTWSFARITSRVETGFSSRSALSENGDLYSLPREASLASSVL
jgi:hypothetical protein